MIAAVVIADWDIAMRAITSLRNRYVSIELLVTIAALGALLIGEYWEAAAVTFMFVFGGRQSARQIVTNEGLSEETVQAIFEDMAKTIVAQG